MTTASRGFAGDSDAWLRRSDDSASDASSDRTSLAVAVDDPAWDDVQTEFDRRVAALCADGAGDLRFRLADFAEPGGERPIEREAESLACVLQQAGPMPAEIAEECVRETLAALRAAHDRRWSHGRLSLDDVQIDEFGVVRLTGVGRLQRETSLRWSEDGDPGAFDDRSDRLWDETFLTGAAEDFRRLEPKVIGPLVQAIVGERGPWAERLARCLDGLDGTIGSLDDVEHAWRSIDLCFDPHAAIDRSAPVAACEAKEPEADPADVIRATVETPIEAPPVDAALPVAGASRVVLFWVCVVGGFAAMAGMLATVIVGR